MINSSPRRATSTEREETTCRTSISTSIDGLKRPSCSSMSMTPTLCVSFVSSVPPVTR